MSVNDFVVRAVALALAEVPEANAIWDAQKQEPQLVESVDVAIAVATDKGLITPIVKAANTKSLAQVGESLGNSPALITKSAVFPCNILSSIDTTCTRHLHVFLD